MDESGSVGLDLSFVSHIFLLEPIADQALEQQVTPKNMTRVQFWGFC